MYHIIGSINGKAYQELVHLLIGQSDSFIFHLPNMGKLLINERNIKFMPEYTIGYSQEEDQDLHNAYLKRAAHYLDVIKNDVISVCKDTGYLDQVSSIEIELYHVAISEKTRDFFSQTNDFSKWAYPALPENPCFLLKRKCVFQCIAHENLCILYGDDLKIKKILERHHVEYYETQDSEIPLFDE